LGTGPVVTSTPQRSLGVVLAALSPRATCRRAMTLLLHRPLTLSKHLISWLDRMRGCLLTFLTMNVISV
jgi:hypothetical protein